MIIGVGSSWSPFFFKFGVGIFATQVQGVGVYLPTENTSVERDNECVFLTKEA